MFFNCLYFKDGEKCKKIILVDVVMFSLSSYLMITTIVKHSRLKGGRGFRC